jgi:hypothetical protein
MTENRPTIFEMGETDREWQDGDDSAREAEAYADGVRDAVAYLADLFEGVYDTNVFEVHCVTRIKETM